MKISFRFPKVLYDALHTDLSRPHSHALERVSFLDCAAGWMDDGGLVLLAETANPVEDSHYVGGHNAGATINSSAFRAVLQRSYSRKSSIFHVHRHEHMGAPRFSETDIRESYRFVPDFFNVQPARPHGVIVLSRNSAYGLCWIPGQRLPVAVSEFVVVGNPISTFRHEK